jgi:poly(3-hydroxybutyrate) depolymerase
MSIPRIALSVACSILLGTPCAMAQSLKALPAPDPKSMTVPVDPADPLKTPLTGLYAIELTLPGGAVRTLKQYFPEKLQYRQPLVALGVPSGQDAGAFLITSGWKKIADDKSITVVLLEASKGGWQADETAYTKAAGDYMQARTYYISNDSAYYLAGYGDAAGPIMTEAVLRANNYAGVAALGIDAFDASVLKKAAAIPSDEAGRMINTIPLPVWLGARRKTPGVEALLAYWKAANQTAPEPSSDRYATEIYEYPRHLSTTNELTSANISKVMLTLGAANYLDPRFAEHLYSDFLMRARRQDSWEVTALRSYAEPKELGQDYYTATVDGVAREFYVFAPTRVRSGKAVNVPVVFVFHGGGGSGREFHSRSGWLKVAEERDFIAVFPTGSRSANAPAPRTGWTRNDIGFFKYMREFVLQTYRADASRIYVSGQSAGGAMTQFVAAEVPELITAVGSCSAIVDLSQSYRDGPARIRTDMMVPIFFSLGTKDQYFREDGGAQRAMIPVVRRYWMDRYHLTEADEFRYVNGPFDASEYLNDRGVPLVRLQWVVDKVHAVIPDEIYGIYDFMSRYSRREGGSLYYMGRAVR